MTDATLRFYRDNARTYVADAKVNPRLAPFLALCPPGGQILELGTGSGTDARFMLDQGFDVDPTDGSPELAREAEARLGRPVRNMLFHELDADAAYDAVYASASLLHAPRAELPGILVRIHTALKPGGIVWASFKSGQQEGHDSLGRYYNYLDAGSLRRLWSDAAPWASVELETWHGSGYDRLPTEWAAVTAKK